jgi:hypothetical protein
MATGGVSREQITFGNFEKALREYRELHPDAIFARDLKNILAWSDFALRNRSLFKENWELSKHLATNPERWHRLAAQFQALVSDQDTPIRSGVYHESLQLYADHLQCRWTLTGGEPVRVRFEMLAAEAGLGLGTAPGVHAAIRRTRARSWADFWHYCLWFYLSQPADSTINDPLIVSVSLCLHLALHCSSDDGERIMDYYPREFSAEARNRVEKEIVLARRALGNARRTLPAPWSHHAIYPSDGFQAAFFASILRVFLVFAKEAVELCQTAGWGLDRADRESKGFLRRFTIHWRYEEGRDQRGNQMREVCDNWGGELERWVNETLRSRPEWTRYEDLLLNIAGGASMSEAGPAAANKDAQLRDAHVEALEAILVKSGIGLETWARDHKLGRTSVFDWKAARLAGRPPQGKVSDSKSSEIEKAIEDDTKALGLTTRTRSD